MVLIVSAISLSALSLCPLPQAPTLGKRAQTLTDTPIYAAMKADKNPRFTVKKYEYLSIAPTASDKWFTVTLKGGQTGFASAYSLAPLPAGVIEAPVSQGFHTATLLAKFQKNPANTAQALKGTRQTVWGTVIEVGTDEETNKPRLLLKGLESLRIGVSLLFKPSEDQTVQNVGLRDTLIVKGDFKLFNESLVLDNGAIIKSISGS